MRRTFDGKFKKIRLENSTSKRRRRHQSSQGVRKVAKKSHASGGMSISASVLSKITKNIENGSFLNLHENSDKGSEIEESTPKGNYLLS